MLITRIINHKNLNHRKIPDNFFDIETHQKLTQKKATKVLYKRVFDEKKCVKFDKKLKFNNQIRVGFQKEQRIAISLNPMIKLTKTGRQVTLKWATLSNFLGANGHA